jgi:hypothetical protein
MSTLAVVSGGPPSAAADLSHAFLLHDIARTYGRNADGGFELERCVLTAPHMCGGYEQ